MRHSTITTAAERALAMALRRWQNDADPPASSRPKIGFVNPESISHCLIGFRIDSILPVDTSHHTAPAPILNLWAAEVTLTLTPRPSVPTPLAQIRAAATNPLIAQRCYHIKWFESGDWLVMPPMN